MPIRPSVWMEKQWRPLYKGKKKKEKKKKRKGEREKGGMRDSEMWVSYVPVRNKCHSITIQSCLTSPISHKDDHSLIHALICGFYSSHSCVFSVHSCFTFSLQQSSIQCLIPPLSLHSILGLHVQELADKTCHIT